MTRTRLLIALATLVGLVVTGSAAPAPPPPPVATCSPGPASCYDWHREAVTVTWSYPGCSATTISNDTGGTAVSCTASNAEGSTTTSVNVRKDGTPPNVRVAVERGPDSNGWFNHPVTVAFSGDDAMSGVSSCAPPATYSGPDSGAAAVSGTCTDAAGNVGTGSVTLGYDATPPTVDGIPERGPDANGWYTRSVKVTFQGADTISGVQTCSAPVVYDGPDTTKASVSGTCRDNAANASQPKSVELSYDATPPALRSVKAESSRRGITLRWDAAADAASFTIVRRPGRDKKAVSTVYTGKARFLLDSRFREGVTYRYTVTAFDQAGNASARTLRAQAPESASRRATSGARSGLRSPVPGARLTAPPLLRWAPVTNAGYYNVQLFRNGKKVLTLWPTRSALRLPEAWRFAGRSLRLTPGVYRWYVWPGFGLRSANRYGDLLGSRTFVVVRR